MNVEVVDFYPKEKNDAGYISGDIRIKLSEQKIEILGIYACRRTNGVWFISLPHRTGVNKDGDPTKFPIIGFEEDTYKALMSALYAQVPAFVEKRLADTANPLVWLVKSEKVKSEFKKPPQITANLSRPILKQREWVDLPPRRPMNKSKSNIK